ncbi:MAG TPA: zinc ABC transporter substrate-binding protein [Pirellulales bacterium]|jgi:manganese/zinc/iron transport system substrate-binding protein|nr:zinc ABC transporter substrate-binding protein [Pirellulales bacterium]
MARCLLRPIATLACLCMAAGCSPSGAGADAANVPGQPKGRPRVVCTTGMVADLARMIGGPVIEVEQLMGEGVDPHLYKPSTIDVVKLSKADLILYSGLHLEGKMSEVFDRMSQRRGVVAVAAKLPTKRLLEIAPGQYDPHVWFDVALWSETTRSVEQALASLDPVHTIDFAQRAETYRAELKELDSECRRRLAEIPAARRVLVTAHDAFHYFGRAYDVDVRAIQGVSTESEAGVREINELVDFMTQRGIKAVFVESSVSSRNVEALVEGCDSHGHHVIVGGELYSDAMGRLGTPDGTYPGMVRHNIDTIVRALK